MKKVCVIGGGPAGLIAAGRAAEMGAKVVLVEKNTRLGVKLLITGKGRCNITNVESDLQFLTEKYGKNGKFLFSSFSRFGVNDVIDFFETAGLKTKVERGGRVFPDSNRSSDVLIVLKEYVNNGKVKVLRVSEVVKIVKREDRIAKILLESGQSIVADNYIVCTGGKSYPETGSTGEIYKLLTHLGHRINKPTPSLVPVVCQEKFIKQLEGLSLKNVDISVWQDRKKKTSRFGEAIFTADGMSGPIILDMSKEATQLLSTGDVKLIIDFKPALSEQALDKRVIQDFQESNNRMFKNSLDQLLPKKLIPVIIQLSKIDGDKKVNAISKEERKKLVTLLKSFEMKLIKVAGFAKAIVTSGGVELKEVDPKTMQSKK